MLASPNDRDYGRINVDRELRRGLFLIIIGALWIFPGGSIPEGTWLITAGVIMLGVNVIRYLNDIKMSGWGVLLIQEVLLARKWHKLVITGRRSREQLCRPGCVHHMCVWQPI